MLTNVSIYLGPPQLDGHGRITVSQYCGEEGANCVLKGAVACSNPFNLEVSSKILQNSYVGKEVYLRIMGSENTL